MASALLLRSRAPLVLGLALALLIACLPSAPHATVGAQGERPASSQETLAQVRSFTAGPDTIRVQRTPDGGRFVDLAGRRRLVLLARTDAQGNLITRCVDSVEQAAAFLSGDLPVLVEPLDHAAAALHQISERVPPQQRAALAASQTTITINVIDGSGEGFNDPTPAAPVGGNPGTTRGAQRLIAFQYAASVWASYLQSTVPIVIDAGFDPLPCTVLGAAGPRAVFADFVPIGNSPGPEFAQTWYVEALANKRAGRDLSAATSDITATFNSDFGTAGCANSGAWYYGLDNQEPQGSADLVAVLLHEIGHGLGFLSLVDTRAGFYGQNYPSDPNPANNLDDTWNYRLYDTSAARIFKDMTAAERARAITGTTHLVWSGPAVTAAAGSLLSATPVLTITAPPTVSGAYAVGVATFGAAPANPPLTGALAAAVDADTDGAGSDDTSADACSPLSNPAAIAGRIALIDRGGCTFTSKVQHAQEAGAVGAIIVNNQPGAPPAMGGSDPAITIVAISISQADGASLRNALASAQIFGQIGLDSGRRAGADANGRVLMYAPASVEFGSSVSHFDTSASPNLLMEPSINSDIGQDVDLTDELLRDIGWYPDQNYNGAPDAIELDLGLNLSATPRSKLKLGSTVTFTLTVTSSGLFGSSAARLSATFPAEMGDISWSASYSGGASGPPSGSGDIDLMLGLPAGSAATLVIKATIVREALIIVNSASISASGPEIDITPQNNQASVSLSMAAETLLLPLAAR